MSVGLASYPLESRELWQKVTWVCRGLGPLLDAVCPLCLLPLPRLVFRLPLMSTLAAIASLEVPTVL